MDNSTETSSSTHILVFPYPAQGHILALLDLSHNLVLKGLSLTIIITPKNLPILSPLLSTHPSIQTLVLPIPSHPKLPPGVEHVRELGNTGNLPIISALSRLRDPIIQWFKSHPNPPVAIISDFFLGLVSLQVSQEVNIPSITFVSVSASLVSINHFCWRNYKSIRQSKDDIEFPGLPEKPVFKEEHLPSIFRLYEEGDPDWEDVKMGMLGNISSSWGCVFNTFQVLEGQYLEHLKAEMGHGRVYGVGPLSLIGIESIAGRADPNMHLEGGKNELLEWLDQCPDDSVLYVCFGSQKVMSKEQMEGLAEGLEKSGIRFIWVVKTPSAQQMNRNEFDLGSMLHEFEARVGNRGRVIKGWVPQVAILNHRAVGGFLSHCGWNSVIEAMVSGVVILAWPMEADQYVNARLLVDDMGVAMRACEGADAVPQPSKLARVIAGAISEEPARDMPEKRRAKELKELALGAVLPCGSSSSDMDSLVMELQKLQRLDQ